VSLLLRIEVTGDGGPVTLLLRIEILGLLLIVGSLSRFPASDLDLFNGGNSGDNELLSNEFLSLMDRGVLMEFRFDGVTELLLDPGEKTSEKDSLTDIEPLDMSSQSSLSSGGPARMIESFPEYLRELAPTVFRPE
jgi:hypothetical protein